MSTSLFAIPQALSLKPGVDFSGIHFNLNVHGVPVGISKPVPDDSGIGRHSVFVPLSNYNLSIAMMGNEWQVPDCDATEDGELSIILPKEVAVEWDEYGVPTKYKTAKAYNVYVVCLGKPSSDSNVVLDPKATFVDDGKVYYLKEKITITGHRKGQPTWYNATSLFLVDIEETIDGSTITTPDQWIFDVESLLNYWWDVTNSGVRLMQVRFYPIF
ncbi:hypothetical protein JW865_06865 [Candidatus Bathyarchaeota archaeon]|nr:hypothetical protein [Candidatus Bathyarchaeota archaeon]